MNVVALNSIKSVSRNLVFCWLPNYIAGSTICRIWETLLDGVAMHGNINYYENTA